MKNLSYGQLARLSRKLTAYGLLSSDGESFVPLTSDTWDGLNRYVVLTANRALTLQTAQATGILDVTQDATGGRTLSVNGQALAINTAPNSVTGVGFYWANGRYVFMVDTSTLAVAAATVTVTPAAPTQGTVNDTLNTFTFTPSVNASVTEHEYRISGGAWTACTDNTIEVGDVALAIGALEVRVKAATGRNASTVLSNAQAFTAAAGMDADAQAFLSAQGITNDATVYFTGTPQERTGAQIYTNTDTYFKALKAGTNSFARLKALYLSLGNGLKNAKTPGTFDLTTSGAGTTPAVGAPGYTFDNVDDYWDTGIIPSQHLGNCDESFGVYVKNITDSGIALGTTNGSSSYLFPYVSAENKVYYAMQQGGDLSGANASAPGLYVASYRNDGAGGGYKRLTKDNVQIHYTAGLVPDPAQTATGSFYLGARNLDGVPSGHSDVVAPLFFVGLGMTDEQASEFTTASVNYLTSMGRN